MDEQILKLSTGPRVGGGGSTKRKTHRAGTKWLQLQKSPTVRTRVERKLMTEARAKYDESEGEEGKGGRVARRPPLDAVVSRVWRDGVPLIQLPTMQDSGVAVIGSPRTSPKGGGT